MQKIICIFVFLLLISCASQKNNTLTKSQRNVALSKIKTQIAIELIKNNNFKDAIVAINEAISLNVNYDIAWLTKALIYQSLNLIPEADANYKKALSLNSKNSEILNNYGLFLCSMKNQPDLAIKYFNTALADPTYITPYLALMNKGICEAKLNNFLVAENDINQAKLMAPDWFREPIKELAKIKYSLSNFVDAYHLFNEYKKNISLDADGILLGWKITKALNMIEENLTYENLLKKNFPNSLELKQILNR